MSIGETLVCSSVAYSAIGINTTQSKPTFSVYSTTIGKTASPTGTSDLTFKYKEVAQGLIANVIVNLV